MFELQQNLWEKKNKIVSMFEKSQKLCAINGDSFKNIGDKTEKTTNKVKSTSIKEKKVEEPEDEVYIIESLKEKRSVSSKMGEVFYRLGFMGTIIFNLRSYCEGKHLIFMTFIVS
jgi:hypothetical protein